jgi:regulator of protease activity HflC (stomatin/prohibitin superfamily)
MWMDALWQDALVAGGIVLLYLLSSVRILFEYQRAVVFRLGRALPGARGPGLLFVFWPFERIVRIGLRTIVQDVTPQDVITRDNVSVMVSAVVYFKVTDPTKAVLGVEDYRFATSQLSQTTLRSVVGQVELDELLSSRERINTRLRTAIAEHSVPWGVDVPLVEIKQVDLPEHMKRAMAKQAESERERRAKVIHAEGEFQAASRLRDAAQLVEEHPAAMQMRFLQTLVEVGAENNSTIVFPLPLDLLAPLLNGKARASNNDADRTRDARRLDGAVRPDV